MHYIKTKSKISVVLFLQNFIKTISSLPRFQIEITLRNNYFESLYKRVVT